MTRRGAPRPTPAVARVAQRSARGGERRDGRPNPAPLAAWVLSGTPRRAPAAARDLRRRRPPARYRAAGAPSGARVGPSAAAGQSAGRAPLPLPAAGRRSLPRILLIGAVRAACHDQCDDGRPCDRCRGGDPLDRGRPNRVRVRGARRAGRADRDRRRRRRGRRRLRRGRRHLPVQGQAGRVRTGRLAGPLGPQGPSPLSPSALPALKSRSPSWPSRPTCTGA